MPQIELHFLGTGTSAGVPMIGCHCPVCSSTDPHDFRDRPSVCISYDGLRVLIDTTPELRRQCLKQKIDSIDAIVFTHAHADHIFGLDDVRRFNAIRKAPLDVWADRKTYDVVSRTFGYAFAEPGVSRQDFRPLLVWREIAGPFKIGSQTWTPIPLIHGDLELIGFRVGSIAYCTDVSQIPEPSFDLLKGLDLLVLDALSTKPHEKHFSLEQAVAAAKRIGAKQTFFTHIGHALGHKATNDTLPPSMQLAFDGQRIVVG